MSRPSEETLIALRGIRTEIGAGKALFPKTIEGRAWNNATTRAESIVQSYIGGYGLFQITAELARNAPGPAPTSAAAENAKG